MLLEQAIEVFVYGFAFRRSLTHPYVPERVEGTWLLQDAPRKSGDYRGAELVAHALPPDEVDRIVRAHARGRYCVSYIRGADEPDGAIRAGFKALRYRLGATEPLMVHSLAHIADAPEPLPIERVTTREQADRLNAAARRKQILPAHLAADPPPVRQVMAVDGAVPVGWVQSVVVGRAAWCAAMYVEPAYRRRGIGRALLTRMLRDDREAGLEASVLTASHTGARLYTSVGYDTLGELLLYTPPRSAGSA